MGLLDRVIGSVRNSRLRGRPGGFGEGPGGMRGALGSGLSGGSPPLVAAPMALPGSGALGGDRLQRFRSSGHGEAFQSRVGPGQHRPIAPHELNEALGPDTIHHLSRQAGMTPDDLLQQLSQVLPGVVGGATPRGRIPDRSETASR